MNFEITADNIRSKSTLELILWEKELRDIHSAISAQRDYAKAKVDLAKSMKADPSDLFRETEVLLKYEEEARIAYSSLKAISSVVRLEVNKGTAENPHSSFAEQGP